jgi:hypothetical protein
VKRMKTPPTLAAMAMSTVSAVRVILPASVVVVVVVLDGAAALLVRVTSTVAPALFVVEIVVTP